MTKDVEDIIRNKAYFELNSDELERINEYAQNEEEYGNMKWFLAETESTFTAEKVTAPPKLKKDVMAHLTESKKKKGFWLNSVGIFLLPQGKAFYKKPGFQLGIAAVAVIGFLFMFNNNDDFSENSMAVVQNSEESHEEVIDLNEAKADQIEEQIEMESQISEDEAIEIPVLEESIEELPEKSLEKNKFDNSTTTDLKAVSRDRRFEFTDSGNEMDEELADDIDVAFSAPEPMTESFDATADKDVEEKEQVAVSNNVVLENRQDAEVLMNEEVLSKKTEAAYTTNASAPVIMQDMETIDYAASGNLFVTKEEISPKSLHIDQTKELNKLFFTEK